MKIDLIKTNNCDIYLYKTKKFKTIMVSTVIINNKDINKVTMNKILCNYLGSSNNNFKDQLSMTKEYFNLYNPDVDIYDLYTDEHAKCFDITFLNEKYTEKGMNKKTIDFYLDLIFNPNIEKDSFNKDSFDIAKEEIRTEISLNNEDPQFVSSVKARSYIRDDVPIKYDYSGNIDDLDSINNKNAYDYYKDSIKNGKFIVFVCGDIDKEDVKDLFENRFNNVNKYEVKPINDCKLTRYNDVKVIKEKEKYNDSFVYVICKLFDTTKIEREVVLGLINEILGGSHSRLFKSIREKESLAYYATSNYVYRQNIFFMFSEVDKKNTDRVIEIMKEQLNSIKNGEIDNEEIEIAKNSIIAMTNSRIDGMYTMLNEMRFKVLFDRYDYEDRIDILNKVTKKDIVSLANKIEIDVIYTLEGEKRNEKN